jgi:hypothetical protein
MPGVVKPGLENTRTIRYYREKRATPMIWRRRRPPGKRRNTRQQACKTCGHAFAGRYCNQCGEKVIEPRDLSVRHYLEDIFTP